MEAIIFNYEEVAIVHFLPVSNSMGRKLAVYWFWFSQWVAEWWICTADLHTFTSTSTE